MVKKAKNAPSAAKMYRHFAVVTVVVTAAVAITASPGSGEKVDEAFTAVEEYSDQQSKEFVQSTKKLAGTDNLIDNSNSRTEADGFADDGWVGNIGAGYSSSVPPRQSGNRQQPPWVLLGMSQSEFEALDPQQRAELLAKLPPQQPDRATMARISEQSMRRAGRTEPSEDAPR